jgi:hypothetical protein
MLHNYKELFQSRNLEVVKDTKLLHDSSKSTCMFTYSLFPFHSLY